MSIDSSNKRTVNILNYVNSMKAIKRSFAMLTRRKPECDLPLANVLVGLEGHVTSQHYMQEDSCGRDLRTKIDEAK